MKYDDLVVTEIDNSKYITAEYYVSAKTNLGDAAWNIAVGQSLGNPSVRNKKEDLMFDEHGCKIMLNNPKQKTGKFKIAFPLINIDLKEDGITQLLCFLMGGHLDIDLFDKCQLKNLSISKEIVSKYFSEPKFGINGIKNYTKVDGKPLLGGIIKPKTGLRPKELFDMVKELVEGGVNFIKEDEILGNPSFCTIKDRLPRIVDYIKDKKVIYAVCINSDYPYLLDRLHLVKDLGGNCVHLNIWSGLSSYRTLRNEDLPLFLFFQKSGDKTITNSEHNFSINWNVICQLAGWMGVDFIHAGMFGGYLHESESDLRKTINTLHDKNVMPSLSCGMHPGLVDACTTRFGNDIMLTVGGAIHGHPDGTIAGALAMRQAIDKKYDTEYNKAIEKWGLIE